jgi:hypothetical protein
MLVSSLIAQSFNQARIKNLALEKSWIAISFRVGTRLPDSFLLMSIQREAAVDLLLRAHEDEVLQILNSKGSDDYMAAHYLALFSSYWVGGMYEIFRLLNERKMADDSPLFEEIFRPLEKVRIALEKHEIAKDKSFKAPVQLHAHPPRQGRAATHQYDPKDREKAHAMPTAVSDINGSLMWLVTDAKMMSSNWVERRWLSDKMLELWGETPSGSC